MAGSSGPEYFTGLNVVFIGSDMLMSAEWLPGVSPSPGPAPVLYSPTPTFRGNYWKLITAFSMVY